MTKVRSTHIAFADESNWNHGRFRAISLVSAKTDDARLLHCELETVRKKLNKSEFKWSNANKRYGIELADFFFSRQDKMRIDVLVWDTNDSRHCGLRNRDDLANFACMYYQLIHNVLKMRWPDNARWTICPHSQNQINWKTMERCLAWKSWKAETGLFDLLSKSSFREYYRIEEIREVFSETHPLIQLADQFAGLGAYSYQAFERYQRWIHEQEGPSLAFDGSGTNMTGFKFSNSDLERLPILDHIQNTAKKFKLQLSLDSSGGFSTKRPERPLNFWLYKAQSVKDKAPLKSR